MNNKLRLSALFLLLLCSFSAAAQIQAERGTVIRKGGQATEGKISYFYDNPAEVILVDSTGRRQIYKPDQVQEIQLQNGKRFVSKSVNREEERKQLMLQVLLESDMISLYKIEETGAKFYVSKDGVLYKLENNKSYVDKKGKTFEKYDYQYVAVLSTLMIDRFDLVKKLKQVKLEEDDLTTVLAEYAKGDITYFLKSNAKVSRSPYYSAYAQFSNLSTGFGDKTTAPSYGYQAGLQYHFSKSGRSSVKLSVDYAAYTFEAVDYTFISLASTFQYEFVQKRRYNAYLNARMFDISKVHRVQENKAVADEDYYAFLFRISPGVGVEAKLSEKLTVFGELNHAMQLEALPKNYSFGLSYKFIRENR